MWCYAGSVLFWVFLMLSSIALFPVALAIWAVTAPFDRRRWVLHRFTCFWASLYTWLNPFWRVEVLGRDHLRRVGPCVMVANHLSTVDILVLFRLFTHFKWVSKIENFRVPFIGWNMRLNRYIPLRRGDRRSAAGMMREAERQIGEGNSIMMFPEGTRSPTGRLRGFKTGAFELALNCRVPLLPLLIEGSGAALPKRGIVLRGRHHIRVRVLDPLAYETFASLSAKELAEQVQSLFATQLSRAQA